MTDLSAAVRAAINARSKAMSDGPRSMADLARAIGVRPSTLHLQLTSRRPMPAETAAAIRAVLPEIPNDN